MQAMGSRERRSLSFIEGQKVSVTLLVQLHPDCLTTDFLLLFRLRIDHPLHLLLRKHHRTFLKRIKELLEVDFLNFFQPHQSYRIDILP